MAQQTKQGDPGGKRSARERNKSPTPKKQNGSKPRNQGCKKTRPEQMYEDYTVIDPGEISDTDEPDVVVDIPVVKVDELHFELDDLMARISLHAEVLDLVKLSVGVHAELGKVELNIKGVEAQALLRARLDHVTAIIDRVLTPEAALRKAQEAGVSGSSTRSRRTRIEARDRASLDARSQPSPQGQPWR